MAAQDGVSASAVDIGHALDHGGWSGFQKWVLALAASALVVDGLANQVIALALPALMKDWHLPRAGFSNVLALGLLGVLIGNFLGGMAGDRFGRRLALIASVLLFGAATAAMAISHGRLDLGVWRLLAGLGVGAAIPNGAAMITEFTPVRRRSVALALGMVFIPVGGVISGVLGAWLLPAIGWQGLFLAAGGLSVAISLVFMGALPESPRFLVKLPHRKGELIKLLGRFGYGFSSDAELVDGERAGKSQPVAALFGRPVLADTLLLWAGFFFTLLASYTLFSWAPAVLSGLGYSQQTASWTMSIFNFGGVVGALLCGAAFAKLGSRISMILCLGGVAVALLLAFHHFDPKGPLWPMVTLMAAVGFFIGAITNGVYTLAAHAYPPFIRATGVGSAGAIGRLGALISSYTAVAALDRGGAQGYFICVAVTVALSVLCAVFMRKQVN